MKKTLTLILICFALSAATDGYTKNKHQPTQALPPEEDVTSLSDKQDLMDTAQAYIRSKLKAPRTAEFAGIYDTIAKKYGNQYAVMFYVDAQNSFGAMIRSIYTVVLIRTNNGSKVINAKQIQ